MNGSVRCLNLRPNTTTVSKPKHCKPSLRGSVEHTQKGGGQIIAYRTDSNASVARNLFRSLFSNALQPFF